MSTENKKLFTLSYEGKAVTISDNLKEIGNAVAALVNKKCEDILFDADSNPFNIKINSGFIECDKNYINMIISENLIEIVQEGGRNFNISIMKNKSIFFNVSQISVV